jgi:hypothetical protein
MVIGGSSLKSHLCVCVCNNNKNTKNIQKELPNCDEELLKRYDWTVIDIVGIGIGDQGCSCEEHFAYCTVEWFLQWMFFFAFVKKKIFV